MPGACAPSTSTRTPRAFAASTMRFTGKTIAVGERDVVDHQQPRARRQARGDRREDLVLALDTGNGTSASTTAAPARAAT